MGPGLLQRESGATAKGNGSGTGDTGRRNGAAPDPLLPPAEVGGSEARGNPGKRGNDRTGAQGGYGGNRGSKARRRFEVARGGRGHNGPALSHVSPVSSPEPAHPPLQQPR